MNAKFSTIARSIFNSAHTADENQRRLALLRAVVTAGAVAQKQGAKLDKAEACDVLGLVNPKRDSAPEQQAKRLASDSGAIASVWGLLPKELVKILAEGFTTDDTSAAITAKMAQECAAGVLAQVEKRFLLGKAFANAKEFYDFFKGFAPDDKPVEKTSAAGKGKKAPDGSGEANTAAGKKIAQEANALLDEVVSELAAQLDAIEKLAAQAKDAKSAAALFKAEVTRLLAQPHAQ